jgi:hypothetical protein
LIAQVRPNMDQMIEYGSSHAMLSARFIQDFTMKANEHRASFGQHILQKGLKVYSGRRDTTHCIRKL